MDMPEIITELQTRELTTGEILAILLFVAEHRMYKFSCCHRQAFNIYQCPVTLRFTVSLTDLAGQDRLVLEGT